MPVVGSIVGGIFVVGDSVHGLKVAASLGDGVLKVASVGSGEKVRPINGSTMPVEGVGAIVFDWEGTWRFRLYGSAAFESTPYWLFLADNVEFVSEVFGSGFIPMLMDIFEGTLTSAIASAKA